MAAPLDQAPLSPDDLESLAAHYVDEVRRIQPVGPYQLLGHSLGGLIAFEMARRLCAEGEGVTFLGLLDTHTPSAYAERRRLPLRRQLANIVTSPVQKVVLAAGRRLLGLLASIPHARRRLAARRADGGAMRALGLRMARNYVPGTYPGAIDLFESQETWEGLRWEPMNPAATGWGALVRGGVRVHPLTGDHLAIVKDPLAEATAMAIEAAIAANDPERRSDDLEAAATVA
jgi:thioesterase domain-containing protein